MRTSAKSIQHHSNGAVVIYSLTYGESDARGWKRHDESTISNRSIWSFSTSSSAALAGVIGGRSRGVLKLVGWVFLSHFHLSLYFSLYTTVLKSPRDDVLTPTSGLGWAHCHFSTRVGRSRATLCKSHECLIFRYSGFQRAKFPRVWVNFCGRLLAVCSILNLRTASWVIYIIAVLQLYHQSTLEIREPGGIGLTTYRPGLWILDMDMSGEWRYL